MFGKKTKKSKKLVTRKNKKKTDKEIEKMLGRDKLLSEVGGRYGA